jgi:Flp pilus assembly protein TadG
MEKDRNRFSRTKEKAQGMVEFALTLPILLMLFFGIIEFGRLLFYYSAVFTASREAARYGSAAGGISGTGNYYQDCTGIRSAAKRIGSFVGIQDADIVISYDHPNPSATTNPVPYATACPPTSAVDLGDRIIVRITGSFRPNVPLVNLPEINIVSVARRTIVKDVEVK